MTTKEVKIIRAMTMQQLSEMGTEVIEADMEKIKEIAQGNPGTPVIKVAFAHLIMKVIADKDVEKFNMLMDRIVGKMPQAVAIQARTVPVLEEKSQRDQDSIVAEAKTLYEDITSDD